MTDDQRYRIADRAVSNVRRSRRLRQQYGVGWLSLVIALTPAIVELVERILEILRDRQAAGEKFALGRVRAYQSIGANGHDAELVALVESAELEVIGA